jgi:hypothetical protein
MFFHLAGNSFKVLSLCAHRSRWSVCSTCCLHPVDTGCHVGHMHFYPKAFRVKWCLQTETSPTANKHLPCYSDWNNTASLLLRSTDVTLVTSHHLIHNQGLYMISSKNDRQASPFSFLYCILVLYRHFGRSFTLL